MSPLNSPKPLTYPSIIDYQIYEKVRLVFVQYINATQREMTANFVNGKKCQTTFFSRFSLSTSLPAKQICGPPIHSHLFTLCFRPDLFFQ